MLTFLLAHFVHAWQISSTPSCHILLSWRIKAWRCVCAHILLSSVIYACHFCPDSSLTWYRFAGPFSILAVVFDCHSWPLTCEMNVTVSCFMRTMGVQTAFAEMVSGFRFKRMNCWHVCIFVTYFWVNWYSVGYCVGWGFILFIRIWLGMKYSSWYY